MIILNSWGWVIVIFFAEIGVGVLAALLWDVLESLCEMGHDDDAT